MRNMYYVDMHCHPDIKPYSWILRRGYNPGQKRCEKTSLWYNDPPNRCDKFLNRIIGLTKFTQSDFRTLTKGDVRIISPGLSPIERGMLSYRGPLGLLYFLLVRYVLGVGLPYLRRVRRRNRNYFEELVGTYNYYISEMNAQSVPGATYPNQFRLTKNFGEIEQCLNDPSTDNIAVFFSIEGCHVFNNSGLSTVCSGQEVTDNIDTVKRWTYRPLYVSMAHHFNNDLCGHERSLPGWLGRIISQSTGMGEGFSDLGERVLHKLLEKETGRIFIDIKHMSARARLEYYRILERDYEGEPIPIIASHGGVNGRDSLTARGIQGFNEGDINFFDDEIIRIHCSGGFLGIQLDERRLCPEEEKKWNRWRRKRCDRLKYHSGLIWNQLRHIAEVLDKKGMFGWDTATIGSDFDGIVDPPNGYWTSEDFGILEENLLEHASTYLNDPGNPLQVPANKNITPEEVINRFMRDNARQFLRTYFTDNINIPANPERDTLCREALREIR